MKLPCPKQGHASDGLDTDTEGQSKSWKNEVKENTEKAWLPKTCL